MRERDPLFREEWIQAALRRPWWKVTETYMIAAALFTAMLLWMLWH